MKQPQQFTTNIDKSFVKSLIQEGIDKGFDYWKNYNGGPINFSLFREAIRQTPKVNKDEFIIIDSVTIQVPETATQDFSTMLYFQPILNSTSYFCNPDWTISDGVSFAWDGGVHTRQLGIGVGSGMNWDIDIKLDDVPDDFHLWRIILDYTIYRNQYGLAGNELLAESKMITESAIKTRACQIERRSEVN